MGQTASSESNGVTCADCALRLPANNWNFELTNNVYYFFDKQEGGKAVVKYLRRQGSNRYICLACVRGKDPILYKQTRIYAAGKATLFIPED